MIRKLSLIYLYGYETLQPNTAHFYLLILCSVCEFANDRSVIWLSRHTSTYPSTEMQTYIYTVHVVTTFCLYIEIYICVTHPHNYTLTCRHPNPK
jgi:hypothetical protein